MLAVTAQDDDLDAGPKKAGTERFCVVTRQARPVDELIRFVVSPGREVVPDVKRKLPGRGLWITATRQAVDDAVRRNVFSRAFKSDVRASAALAATTEDLLVRAALDALAIAGKAGLVLAGFGKTEDAIGRERLVALIHASDAAADGTRKLAAAVRREDLKIPVIAGLSSEQLDLALGRINVVHAALLAGSASDTFVARASRLEGFRAGEARLESRQLETE